MVNLICESELRMTVHRSTLPTCRGVPTSEACIHLSRRAMRAFLPMRGQTFVHLLYCATGWTITCRQGLRLERMRGRTSADTRKLVGAQSPAHSAPGCPEAGPDAGLELRMVALHTSRQKVSITGPVLDRLSDSCICLSPGLEAPHPSARQPQITRGYLLASRAGSTLPSHVQE